MYEESGSLGDYKSIPNPLNALYTGDLKLNSGCWHTIDIQFWQTLPKLISNSNTLHKKYFGGDRTILLRNVLIVMI